MKHKKIIQGCLALVIATVGMGSNLSVQELVWSPDAGTRLRREVVTKHALTSELMRTTVNGEESLSQRLLTLICEQKLTVTDDLLEIEGGRPTLLRRYFDGTSFVVDTEQSIGGKQTKNETFKGVGTLQDTSVVFTWLPDEEAYGRYYDDKESIEEVLPGLVEDLSMRSILPTGPVKLGDSWDLPPGVLADVFATGGDTNYKLGGDVGHAMIRTMRLGTGLYLDGVFGAKETGKVTCMLTGVEELEGRRLAMLYLTFDVVAERDLKDRAGSAMSIEEVALGFRVESAVVSVSLKGSGMLRWDIDRGHLFDTQDLRADERVSTRLEQVLETERGRFSNIQELVMVGSVRHSVTCTPQSR